MKINKLFCIDLNIVEKLVKVDNQSKLINDLLSDYFAISSNKSTILEQKISIMQQEKAKIKKIKNDLKVLKYVNELKFDQMCVNWVLYREFIYNDEDISAYIRQRRLKITLNDFKNCAEKIKSNGNLFKKTG